MGLRILWIALGAALGLLCRVLCDRLTGHLLQRREKPCEASRPERLLGTVLSVAAGGLIGLLAESFAEAAYFFLLLIPSQTAALADLRARVIPNEMVLALLGVTLLFGIPGALGAEGFPAWRPLLALLGLVVCFVIFLLPAALSKQVGAGDIKLAGAMGFCLGLWGGLFAVVLMGLMVLAYTVLQYRIPTLIFLKSKIPMGPFLAAAMVGMLLLEKLPLAAELLAAMPL